ncbi:hypothetical protein EQY69_07470 [Clostridium perfringens]|nr:hypothetical protein [Clostridium perfringens]
MSINSNMKLYEVYKVKEGENELLEPVITLIPYKKVLISLSQSITTKKENGVTNRYVHLKGLSYDRSLKNNMVVKVNGGNFKITNMPFMPLKKISFDLEEFKEC